MIKWVLKNCRERSPGTRRRRAPPTTAVGANVNNKFFWITRVREGVKWPSWLACMQPCTAARDTRSAGRASSPAAASCIFLCSPENHDDTASSSYCFANVYLIAPGERERDRVFAFFERRNILIKAGACSSFSPRRAFANKHTRWPFVIFPYDAWHLGASIGNNL